MTGPFPAAAGALRRLIAQNGTPTTITTTTVSTDTTSDWDTETETSVSHSTRAIIRRPGSTPGRDVGEAGVDIDADYRLYYPSTVTDDINIQDGDENAPSVVTFRGQEYTVVHVDRVVDGLLTVSVVRA